MAKEVMSDAEAAAIAAVLNKAMANGGCDAGDAREGMEYPLDLSKIRGIAKEIDRIRQRARREKNRDKINQYARDYYYRHKEKIIRERRERMESDPEYAAKRRADLRVKSKTYRERLKRRMAQDEAYAERERLRKREYYFNVTKPRLQAMRELWRKLEQQ